MLPERLATPRGPHPPWAAAAQPRQPQGKLLPRETPCLVVYGHCRWAPPKSSYRRRDISFDDSKKECFSIEDGSDMPLRTTSQLGTLKRMQVNRGNIQCKYINVVDENKKKSICTMAKNEVFWQRLNLSGEQRDILSNDLFNQELECLKGRIEQVECTRTHEDIVRTSLKLLSELEKDLNALTEPGGSHPTSSCSHVGCRCPNGH